MKAVQSFSDEYLQRCQQMSTDEIASFLEQFRLIHGGNKMKAGKSKLISIKVPEDLLDAFKTKSKLQGIPYQTQIKKLMSQWLVNAPE